MNMLPLQIGNDLSSMLGCEKGLPAKCESQNFSSEGTMLGFGKQSCCEVVIEGVSLGLL